MTKPTTQPRLAICIPTHDGRAPFLREALESVLSQLGETPPGAVTICISDNASQDETQALVQELQARHPDVISYHRHERNLGFLPNMLQAMREARGEYGWLLSSDDRIAPGGLWRIWEALDSEPDLAGLSVAFQAYDVTMTHPLDPLPARLYPADRWATHLYTSLEDAFRACGSVAGYFSGQVYHRALWQETLHSVGLARVEAAGYFPYVLLLGEMLKRRPRWRWLPDPAVENRMENDSVTSDLNRNILRYQCNVLHDMTEVWASLLGRRSTTFQELMRDNYATIWNWRAVCSYKVASHCPLTDDVRALVEFTRHLSSLPGFWTTVFPILLVPHQVLRAFILPVARLLRLARPGQRGPAAEGT